MPARKAGVNQKGGVGKTFTIEGIGQAYAEAGQRVLYVDYDPQGHLTDQMGVAYHAKPVVAAAARAQVDHGDLTVLLYLQGYRDDEIARD